MFYFIVNEARTRVKIGKSKDPAKRLKTIQTGTEEELLLYGTLPGDRIEERTLHKRFAKHRLRGEWFDFKAIEQELKEIVSEDREIRPDRTYPFWEFRMITGYTKSDVHKAEAKAHHTGIVKFYRAGGLGEWDCLCTMDGEIRGWVWCKMVEDGCVQSLLF